MQKNVDTELFLSYLGYDPCAELIYRISEEVGRIGLNALTRKIENESNCFVYTIQSPAIPEGESEVRWLSEPQIIEIHLAPFTKENKYKNRFLLTHEMAHIALGHYEIYEKIKSLGKCPYEIETDRGDIVSLENDIDDIFSQMERDADQFAFAMLTHYNFVFEREVFSADQINNLMDSLEHYWWGDNGSLYEMIDKTHHYVHDKWNRVNPEDHLCECLKEIFNSHNKLTGLLDDSEIWRLSYDICAKYRATAKDLIIHQFD